MRPEDRDNRKGIAMLRSTLADRVAGGLIVAISLSVIAREWGLGSWVASVAPVLTVALLALFAVQVGPSRLAFILVGLVLTGVSLLYDPDWSGVIGRGLASAAFIAAFFAALGTLRNAADSAPSIRACGRFLSQQPPGRRYIALTVGGQLFALLLNYGAIVLLGSLATANAADEPDAEIRAHRTRRMLLAIQRGFLSTLPWSPLSFAVAISTALIPGTSWAGTLLPCMTTGAILVGLGWALDTIFKPRLARRPSTRAAPEGNWGLMLPLFVLLGILVSAVLILSAITDIRIVGLVIVIVPVISMVWIGLQTGPGPAVLRIARRVRGYVGEELPAYRGEITLLMMAGYIGTVGAHLLVPVVAASGLDLAALPAWTILVALVWIIPLAGQLGMNPILAVSLLAPLLPSAAEMGVSPTAIIVAITAGWAMSGATSPYTATTLMIGSFAGISAGQVGRRWNGGFALLAGVALSIWVALFATMS